MAQIKLSDTHWDCECETNYIRPNCLHKCEVCGFQYVEQPPSRVNEVNDTGSRIKQFNDAYFVGVKVFWFDENDVQHTAITTTQAHTHWDILGSPVVCLSGINTYFLDRIYVLPQ